MTRDEAKQNMIATFYDKAKPYLSLEDRDKLAMELEPKAKALSFHLLAEVLFRMTPNPAESIWHSFGVASCRGEGEESELLAIYQLLLVKSDGSYFYEHHNRRRSVVQPVNFEVFWKAYEAGALIQLMDSQGLKELRSRLPFLENFLSARPPGAHPSVWDLKQFLEIGEPIDYPCIPAVSVDYGFVNCRNFEETCILMEIYGRVMKVANALELHQACVAGDLFDFACAYVQMEDQWRSLMRNPYPLQGSGDLSQGPGLRSEARPEVIEDSVRSAS